MVRKILIAVDGSEHSERAINWYAANLNREDDTILFAYIAEPAAYGYGAGASSPEICEKNMREAVSKAKELSASVGEKCKSLGVRANLRFLEKFCYKTGQALVEIATDEQVDLIIVGNRGINQLRRTFLGSVSDYVLHHAHKPTVVVPPPKHKGEKADKA